MDNESILLLLNSSYNLETVSVEIINGKFYDYDLVKEGLMFDEEYCFSTNNLDLSICTRMFLMDSTIYGIFYKNEYVGLVGVMYHHPKDKTRLEICCCIKRI